MTDVVSWPLGMRLANELFRFAPPFIRQETHYQQFATWTKLEALVACRMYCGHLICIGLYLNCINCWVCLLMLLAGWKFMFRASFSNYNVRNPVFIGILKFSSLYTWCTALTSRMQAGAQHTVATEHGLRFYRTRGAGSFKEATADF